MEVLELIVKPFPVSVNQAYTIMRYNRSRRILTNKARNFKESAKLLLEDDLDIIRDFTRSVKDDEIIIVQYILCRPFLNKGNGKPKIIDADNYVKLTQDVVFDVLKINDSMVWDISVRKMHTIKRDPFVFVKITKDKLKNFIEE